MGRGSHGPTGPTSVNQTVLFPANGNEGRARKDVPRCPRGLPPVCSAYVSVWLCHGGHGRRKEEQAERTHSSFRSWICQGPRTKRPTTTCGHRTKYGAGVGGRKEGCELPGNGCPGQGHRRGSCPPPGSADGHMGRHSCPQNDVARRCPADQWGLRVPRQLRPHMHAVARCGGQHRGGLCLAAATTDTYLSGAWRGPGP